MKSIVKPLTTFVIIMSVLAILIGGMLIADPIGSALVYGIMLGSYMIVQGIVLIILDIKSWRKNVPFDGLLIGILSVILGIMLLKNLNPVALQAAIGTVFGIYIIINSISGIKTAVTLKRTGAPWVLMLILNIIGIILGGYVLYAPIISGLVYTTYAGIILIVESIISIILMVTLRKNEAEVEKLIIEKANEVNAQQFNEVASQDVKEEAQEIKEEAQDDNK